jgi:hypothetical protein
MSNEKQDPPSTGRPLRSETGVRKNTNQSQNSSKDNKKPKP